MRIRRVCCVLILVFAALSLRSTASYAQTTFATVTGEVTDQQGRVVPGATIVFTNVNTNIPYSTQTNEEGIYRLVTLHPGIYRANVTKDGFKSIVKGDIELHVQDQLSINFELQVGSVTESITVVAGTPLVNTESAAVSTVVNRQFAENLPMNGRSFQTLIQLTPGVVLTTNNGFDTGQFSVNGQRAASNYWMVDGVSGNIGTSGGATPGNGFSGSLGSFSVLGGTNSLVSVDALQEFRIQTSTYAPEFGRMPGGQISIVTRSGTNQFHGTLFEYLRNDVLDANDWFANSAGLPKPKERQNDFGGTLSGPILKDRTFFFFTYEGLRLRLPQTVLSTVPSLSARNSATAVTQPYLNAYPLPNPGATDNNGISPFDASFSNSSILNAYSFRIDHRLNGKLSLFGRYNYSPSGLTQRGLNSSLSTLYSSEITTHTATIGNSWAISPVASNDLRFNYSRATGSARANLDNFGGAVPLASLPLPNSFTSSDSNFLFYIYALTNAVLRQGQYGRSLQRQINIVDTVSVQRGSHILKFGLDFRRLSPEFDPPAYSQQAYFLDVPSAQNNSLYFSFVTSSRSGTLLFRNLGVFAQDTWRIVPRLTITYGLRWDVEFAPSSASGPSLMAVTGFNANDLSKLALAPSGTPPYHTSYGGVAPRLGLAYKLSQNQDWGTVLRGGFGVFYDLGTQEVGNILLSYAFPFGAFRFTFGGNFPLDPVTAAPPPITAPGSGSGTVYAFNPHLQLPYTLQWNIAIEQGLGRQQALSASYIGSLGKRLIQSEYVARPNPNYSAAQLVGNSANSYYSALQLQFQRRLSHGLQALASYAWSHSIDTASASSAFGNNGANTLAPNADQYTNRGPSDFDIRHSFSAGVTYDVPVPKVNGFVNGVLGGWSLQNIIQIHSAQPLNLYYSTFYAGLYSYYTSIRPDVVTGQFYYLYGPQYPGGKALNPAAFTAPPTDSNGNPLRQGNLGRNALRGFGASQWDFSVHRDFAIHESLKLQFRAEMFNVLNHPNFGPPMGDLSNPQFGRSTQMLGRSLTGSGLGVGAFAPLYQIAGPRSIQLALKLMF